MSDESSVCSKTIQSVISHIFCVTVIFLSISPSSVLTLKCRCRTTTSTYELKKSGNIFENFGTRLYTKLVASHPNENIIFSPLSIQTCIAMARIGAKGRTAREMDAALSIKNFGGVAITYHDVLAKYENSSILKIANKMYVNQGYKLLEQFNKIVSRAFFASVDSINFANITAAAHTINSWVESKTNNLIKDLISPDLLSPSTALVLINAIHFKGQWVNKFQEKNTHLATFYLDDSKQITIPMMRTTANFDYGSVPELEAFVLEMPYKNSDLSMLIVLPYSRTGLSELEKKLQTVSLSDIAIHMHPSEVFVEMPKFKAEFQADLSEPLKKMGLRRMFSSNADFSGMLKYNEALQISQVVHKAFIEVNEEGAEAAAATGIVLDDRMGPAEFIVDSPFHYIIKNEDNVVLFEGSIRDNF